MTYSTVRLISALLSVGLTGCVSGGDSHSYPERFFQYSRSQQIKVAAPTTPLPHTPKQVKFNLNNSALAAAELIDKANGAIRKDSPMIVASFADSESMTATTGFGRMLSQQFSTQLVNSGYRVAELLMRENIYIAEKGEFLLSRKAKDLSQQYEAHAAVVGTYVVGNDTIFVNAKIVDIATNTILAANNFNIVIDENVKKMLQPSQYIQANKS